VNGNSRVNVCSLLFLDDDIFLGSHKQDYGSMLNLMTVSMVRKKLFLAFAVWSRGRGGGGARPSLAIWSFCFHNLHQSRWRFL